MRLRLQKREDCLKTVTQMVEDFVLVNDVAGLTVGVSVNGRTLYKKGEDGPTVAS